LQVRQFGLGVGLGDEFAPRFAEESTGFDGVPKVINRL
jgi:hypothetical protein